MCGPPTAISRSLMKRLSPRRNYPLIVRVTDKRGLPLTPASVLAPPKPKYHLKITGQQGIPHRRSRKCPVPYCIIVFPKMVNYTVLPLIGFYVLLFLFLKFHLSIGLDSRKWQWPSENFKHTLQNISTERLLLNALCCVIKAKCWNQDRQSNAFRPFCLHPYSTGWPFRLWQTSCWHHNISSVLIWGANTET